MAYSDNQYTMGIKDLVLYRAGTSVQLPVAQAASVSPMVVGGILRGSGKIAAANSYIEGCEGQIGMGGWPLKALQVILGMAAPTPTGSTPNQATQYGIAAGDALPYFTMLGRTQDGVGGDVHIVIPKAKIMKGFKLDVKDGANFVAPSIDFTGIPDANSKAFFLIAYEATTALATSLAAAVTTTTITATAAAATASIVTLTKTAHGLSAGQWGTVAGCTEAYADAVNGLKQIIAVPTADTFTIAAIGAGTDAAVSGTITFTY
jgi:hypothetical protein